MYFNRLNITKTEPKKKGTKRSSKKDDFETKGKKRVGRKRLGESTKAVPSGGESCPSCKQDGHSSSRSSSCPNRKLSMAQREKQELGVYKKQCITLPLKSFVRDIYFNTLFELISAWDFLFFTYF